MKDIKSYCVYRILDKDNNILYIGKSEQLETRIKNHIRGRSNLTKECRDKIARVEYLEFYGESDMSIFEIYAICYYKPKYNIENKDDLTLLRLDIPNIWNELNIETFQRIVNTSPMGICPRSFINKVNFNREIMLNEDLSKLLFEYQNTIIDEEKQKKIAQACGYKEFELNEINDYIKYNNSRMKFIKKNEDIILIKNKKGLSGYGSWKKAKAKNNEYLQYDVFINNKIKSFYGKNKKEVADKVDEFLNNYIVTDKVEKVGTVEERKGINAILYNPKPNNSPILLSTEDVMNYFYIKDVRTLKKIVANEQLPYVMINNNMLFPLDKLNKWINNKTINNIK